MRGLIALPVVLLMGLALLVPASALAEATSGYGSTPTTPESTSGYGSTPTTPSTTPTTTTTPSTGTSPSKEEGTPTTTTGKETTPTSSSTSPAKETAKTLPFTGFDLRWSFGIGLALMAAGFSIVMVQRRRRENGS